MEEFCQMVASQPLSRFTQSLPKVELHAHLNGSIRDSTIIELCQEKGIDPSKLHLLPGQERSLADCFEIFALIHKLNDNLGTLSRVVKEVIEDFANDGVLYLELRSTPRDIPTKRAYVETLLHVCRLSSIKYNIIVRVILSIDRRVNTETACEVIELAREFSNQGVVGIDLCGNPTIGKFDTWIPAFELAKKYCLPITLHFAEVPAPEESRAMLRMKPNRLGHGCYLDDGLKKLMFNSPVPLEVCLTSNVKTGSTRDISSHHFSEFFEKGYPVILCTDDKGVFQTSLSKEYALAAETFGLNHEQLFQLARSGINHSFASETLKDFLRQDFDKIRKTLY